VIAGPLGEWIVSRDYEFCMRIKRETGFSIYSPEYDITSHWVPEKRRGVPVPWIRRVYRFAESKKRRFIHLVGFSGGAAVASSQLVDYPDDSVQTLVVISGPVAEGGPHTDAAAYADKIKVRTLLIYGKQDGYNHGVGKWTEKAREANVKVDNLYYEGGHDFGRSGDPSFEQVTKKVMAWLASTYQDIGALKLRRRRKRGRKRKRS